jgi:spermidine synthase
VFLLDAFDDLRSVRSLATEAFYAACRDALRPRGVFAVNFIADEPRFGTYLARLERVFDGRVLCLPSQDRMNMIVLGFRAPLDPIRIAPLKRVARELERRLGLPFDRFVRDLVAHNPGDATHLDPGGKRDAGDET